MEVTDGVRLLLLLSIKVLLNLLQLRCYQFVIHQERLGHLELFGNRLGWLIFFTVLALAKQLSELFEPSAEFLLDMAQVLDSDMALVILVLTHKVHKVQAYNLSYVLAGNLTFLGLLDELSRLASGLKCLSLPAWHSHG